MYGCSAKTNHVKMNDKSMVVWLQIELSEVSTCLELDKEKYLPV